MKGSRLSGEFPFGLFVVRAVQVRAECAQPVNRNTEDDAKIEIQPGAQECFLRYILRLKPVIEQSAGRTPHRELVTPDEFAKRMPVAGPRSDYEFGIVVRVHSLLTG